MSRLLPLTLSALLLASATVAVAEVPLPDAIYYGTLRADGVPRASGDLVGRVDRPGLPALFVPGVFVDVDGHPFYILRVPVETAIGAPGPTGAAAHAGDILATLVLDGEEVDLAETPASISPGGIQEIDGHVEGGGGDVLVYFRGDCNSDRSLDISDPVSLLAYLFLGGDPPGCDRACDADDNSSVEITDAIVILARLFTGGAPLPAPSGGCGPDASIDPLTCISSPCA